VNVVARMRGKSNSCGSLEVNLIVVTLKEQSKSSGSNERQI
jgi:hypothetical protein